MSDVLAAVERAASDVRETEATLDEKRVELRRCLVAAHETGVSITLLAKAVGLSHQRVSQILHDG